MKLDYQNRDLHGHPRFVYDIRLEPGYYERQDQWIVASERYEATRPAAEVFSAKVVCCVLFILFSVGAALIHVGGKGLIIAGAILISCGSLCIIGAIFKAICK